MSIPANNPEFQTTHWSVVASSRREQDSELRRESLGKLYQSYWYPLFAYLRRKGKTPDDAADLVQGFFAELIDKDFLNTVEPDKGRFRWFLKSAIHRFASKERDKSNALKRGGGRQLFSLDLSSAEQRYQMEPIDGWTAERLYERRWALQVLEHALQKLRDTYRESDSLSLYEALQPTLTGHRFSQQEYEQIGGRLEMSAGSVKVAAYRMRERYRDALVAITQQTLTDSGSVDDELDQLLNALQGQESRK